MACPFFLPVAPFEDGLWMKPPRLPLGDPCRGFCSADPLSLLEPSLDELRTLCNSGYARDSCNRFPAAEEADAIRFSIASDRDGTVEMIYVLEKEYGPLRHGSLRYRRDLARFDGADGNAALRAQAERFVESYLKRRTAT